MFKNNGVHSYALLNDVYKMNLTEQGLFKCTIPYKEFVNTAGNIPGGH